MVYGLSLFNVVIALVILCVIGGTVWRFASGRLALGVFVLLGCLMVIGGVSMSTGG